MIRMRLEDSYRFRGSVMEMKLAPAHFRRIAAILLVTAAYDTSHAAEGGYSNYIPGFYSDLALAVAPPD